LTNEYQSHKHVFPQDGADERGGSRSLEPLRCAYLLCLWPLRLFRYIFKEIAELNYKGILDDVTTLNVE